MATVTSERAAWLAERNTILGASESPSICGVGYESPYAVWARKCGLVPSDEEESELLEAGTLLQPAIIALARRRTGLDIREAPLEIRRGVVPYVGCTLDAYYHDDEGLLVPVECKNVGLYNAGQWKDDLPPIRVNVQVQHQMYVAEAPRALVLGLIGGNRLVVREVPRDEGFIRVLLGVLRHFWGHVERKDPPPVDGSESTAETLAKLYDRETGDEVELPDEAAVWDRERLEAIEAEKAAKGRRAAAENALKAAIGSAAAGRLPGGGVYRWRTIERAGYTCQATSYRQLTRSAK